MVANKDKGQSPSRTRPFFRIIAMIISLPAICMGVLALISNSPETPSSSKFGVSSLALGILFLLLGIRGRLLK